MGVVLSLSLGSWRLWNKDGEIPELKNHWIYWNCPALSYSQNRGSGERGLASWGGHTVPQAVSELLGPHAQGHLRAACAFWARVVAAEGALLLLLPLSRGGTGEGCGKKKKADSFKRHGCQG